MSRAYGDVFLIGDLLEPDALVAEAEDAKELWPEDLADVGGKNDGVSAAANLIIETGAFDLGGLRYQVDLQEAFGDCSRGALQVALLCEEEGRGLGDQLCAEAVPVKQRRRWRHERRGEAVQRLGDMGSQGLRERPSGALPNRVLAEAVPDNLVEIAIVQIEQLVG